MDVAKLDAKINSLGESKPNNFPKQNPSKINLEKIIDIFKEETNHKKTNNLELVNNFPYASKSLFIFPQNNKLRRMIIQIIDSKWFNYAISFIILTNTVLMAFNDYSERLFNGDTKESTILNSIDNFFNVCFILEFVLKIIGMGFITEKNTYLRDGWNVIDFSVVISMLFSFVPNLPNIEILKILRVLRPLRTLKTIKGIRVLVESLIDSVPAFTNVLFFLAFFILFFGILGIQFFSGIFEQRCRLTPFPENGVWLIDENYTNLCVIGDNLTCPLGEYCGNPFQYNLPFNQSELNRPELLYGLINFDNILYASLSIFVCMVIDGWTRITYIYGYGYNKSVVKIFFTFVMIFGGLFLINLILAVINQSFEKFHEDINSNSQNEILPKITDYSLSNIPGNISADLEKLKNNSYVYKKSKKKTESKLPTIRQKLNKIFQSQIYLAFVTVVILLNTIFLSLDHYPMTKEFGDMLNSANFFFTVFFFFEMIIKIFAFGPLIYIKDKMNLFDLFIVWSSILDLILQFTLSNNGISQISSLAALRAFRLFRMFKILRAWSDLKILIQALIESLISLKYFSILLLNFMVIATFLGNELFAYRVRFISETDFAPDLALGYSKRINFDNFINGLLSVFIILTNQSWIDIMIDHIRAFDNNMFVPLYFIFIIIIGDFLLLNLFLAILINNFGETAEKIEHKTKKRKSYFSVKGFINSLTRQNKVTPYENKIVNPQKITTPKNILISSPSKYQKKENADINKISKDEILKKVSNPENLDNFESDSVISQAKIPSIENFSIIQKNTNNQIKTSQPTIHRNKSEEFLRGLKGSILNFNSQQSENLLPQQINSRLLNFSHKKVFPLSKSKFLKEIRNIQTKSSDLNTKEIQIDGNSLFIFGPKNKLRKFCVYLTNNKKFESFLLFLIIVSSTLLALDNPLTNPQAIIKTYLSLMDLLITCIFLIEILIKILSMGLFFSKDGYLRNPWNVLDFLIIIGASVSSFGLSNQNISIIKTFRLTRILRPLRLISRNEGLKITINSLIKALPNIFNLVMLNSFFFLLYGILGTTLFKGEFFYCDSKNIPENFWTMLNNKNDCLDYGGDWVNNIFNFDHIGKSMMYLFIISTKEAWTDAMYAAEDATGIDQSPIQNNNKYVAIYFVSYIIIGSYIMLNLFVGIVFESFKKEKERIEGVSFLSKNQLEWINIQLNIIKEKPIETEKMPENSFRKFFFKLVDNTIFEKFIIFCIILNIIIFMLYWSRQHAVILQILTVMNMVFIVIFAFEATFKLIAYGSNYFRSGWNIIDLVVILLGIVGAALDYFISFDLGSSSSIIRSFRIGRLIRLIKKAKSLNMIFNTLIFTLPALANIGSLLFLGIFIFSIIGINNFAFLKNGNQINENANFRTFANSFFTLLRVSTGENWDGVLLDSVAYQQPNFVCYPILNYYDYERYGMMGCGTSWAYLYYIIFEVFFTMVFMNLFIAVVLEGFYQSHIEYDLHISENHLTQFKAIWKKYDPNAIGFIHINHLEDLLLNLESPLGWKKMNYNHKEKLMKVSRLNIPVYSIKRIKIPIYCFYDVANALAEHALIEEFKLIDIEPKQKVKPMKTIEDKMKKFLSKVKHILKTDLNSAHMIAGKIIFRKYFKNSKINIHEEYIEKIIGERGNAEEETKEYYQRKIDEIKTPQLKRKIHSLVKEMKLSNISLPEEDKNEKIFNNYKSQRNIRKIMSAKVINIKNELTDIFNLNKSMAIIKENNDISIDEIVNQEILPSEEIFFKKQKLKNKKLVSDMKKLFDL